MTPITSKRYFPKEKPAISIDHDVSDYKVFYGVCNVMFGSLSIARVWNIYEFLGTAYSNLSSILIDRLKDG